MVATVIVIAAAVALVVYIVMEVTERWPEEWLENHGYRRIALAVVVLAFLGAGVEKLIHFAHIAEGAHVSTVNLPPITPSELQGNKP